jgi:hypothetical protein
MSFGHETIESKSKQLTGKFDEEEDTLKSETFINCDIRYFNLDYVVHNYGHFDFIMIDPPWRIKGAQRNNSSYMFSNNKFNLEYNTMSN